MSILRVTSVFCLLLFSGMFGDRFLPCRGARADFSPAASPPAKQSAAGQVIDGATDPEKIPNEVAWLMLFKSIADAPNAPDWEVRASFVRPAGFTNAEVTAVISAANQAMFRIGAMEARILLSSLPMDQKTKVLRAERDSILRDAVSDLLLRMSPEGARKFREHVDSHVKRRIKITP